MARKFFYICAGMFLLALSYHLGASTATAQAGGTVECAGITNGEAATAVIGRHVFALSRSAPLHPVSSSPIPGVSPVIACEGSMVVLENGEVWMWYEVGGPEWVFVGTFGGGPTPALHQSWSQVKARYHATVPATPGKTVTPGADSR